MGLPSSRNTTYSPATPIKSADLNLIQDCLVGAKRSSAWRWMSPCTPNVINTNTMNLDGVMFAAAGHFEGMSLGMWQEGDRITGMAVRHIGTGVSCTPVYTLNANLGNGAPVVIGTLTFVNPGATWNTYTYTLATPYVLPAAVSLFLSETASLPVSNKLGLVGIQSDRL